MDPDLSALAAAHGVATSYEDFAGRVVEVSAEAVTAVLGALGVDATDPVAALRASTDAAWARLLPPTVVAHRASDVVLHAPAGSAVAAWVELEDGGRVDLVVGGVLTERGSRVRREVALPELPLGWHVLHATADDEHGTGSLVVAPASLPRVTGRSWGWAVQLYALRGAGSWGVGDYADLRTVVARTAADGGGLVLCNPLHAETPVLPLNPSPYSPSSRRSRSPVGLRVADVPELAAADPALRAQVEALRPSVDPERVLRDPTWTAVRQALELLWPGHRAEALAAFRAEVGDALEGYAAFCALAEVHGPDWRVWPERLRRPDGPGVAAATAELADRVAFWCWVQMLVDEQLAAVAVAARGMAVGVVHDLAVGVDPAGADAWALQDALALGSSVGAPPDSFNQQGQDWGLPPWRPDRLAELGYAPLRDLVRGVLRHAGGLRVDHVMGLFRLWWVPPGAGAAGGTYVSYDADAMLGVLALEAHRAGALVVGEDLGTVEERVREQLSSTGVLGSAVLWFEVDDAGEPVPPTRWREQAMASVTTHDLPTCAGFLADEHVRVRDELGQLGVPVEQERERVAGERARLLAMLTAQGLLGDGDAVLGMHRALVASPSRLVVAALGDAVGDLRQPNLPGTVDAYPNWRLPVADGTGRPLGLEELLASPGVGALTRVLQQASPAGSVGSGARPDDGPDPTRSP